MKDSTTRRQRQTSLAAGVLAGLVFALICACIFWGIVKVVTSIAGML